MSTAGREVRDGRRCVDEGHPDTWATDAEPTPAGILLHCINIDGERRRVFVSDVVSDGIADMLERDVNEETADDEDAPDTDDERYQDAAQIETLETEVARLETEVDRLRTELASGDSLTRSWEAMVRAMWTAAGYPDDVAVSRLTIERARSVIAGLRMAAEQPVGAIAEAAGLDRRSTPSAVVERIKEIRGTDTGIWRGGNEGRPWTIEEINSLVGQYDERTDGAELHSHRVLVEALRWAAMQLEPAMRSLNRAAMHATVLAALRDHLGRDVCTSSPLISRWRAAISDVLAEIDPMNALASSSRLLNQRPDQP